MTERAHMHGTKYWIRKDQFNKFIEILTSIKKKKQKTLTIEEPQATGHISNSQKKKPQT